MHYALYTGCIVNFTEAREPKLLDFASVFHSINNQFKRCFNFYFIALIKIIAMFQDWHPLGQILYRKWHVYDMSWDPKIKLENFIVCGAPFGGPIAMMLDIKKANLQPEMEIFHNKLLIKTSSGNHISTIDWDDKPIVGMGWSDQEHLITVLENGCVKLFDIHGKQLTHFSLLEHFSRSEVRPLASRILQSQNAMH